MTSRDTTAAVGIPLAARWLAFVRPGVEGRSSIVAVVGGECIGSTRTIGFVPGASRIAREAIFVAVTATVVAAVVIAIGFKDGHFGGKRRQALGRRLTVQRSLPTVGPDPAKCSCRYSPATGVAPTAGSLVVVIDIIAIIAPTGGSGGSTGGIIGVVNLLRWQLHRRRCRCRCHRYRRPARNARCVRSCTARRHGEEGGGDVGHAAANGTAATHRSDATVRAHAGAWCQPRPAHAGGGGRETVPVE